MEGGWLVNCHFPRKRSDDQYNLHVTALLSPATFFVPSGASVRFP
jgi:hypothetical protein